VNVVALEEELLKQWGGVLDSAPMTMDRITLKPSLAGITADHGARSKSIGSNSVTSRCGECTAIFSKDVPYGFLDWNLLSTCRPVRLDNWAATRFGELPEHLRRWALLEGGEATFTTFDNHHNVVGHIQDLFKLLYSLIPAEFKPRLKDLLFALTSITASTRPRGSKLQDWKFYRGFHWRLVSLHLPRLFSDVWASDEVRESFEILFALLTEIHVFNYTHWDRQHPSFETIRHRYVLVLVMYTMQLRACFTADEAAALNTIYLHKILVHSLWAFRVYNLAACSCEQGEGMVSIVNGILPNTSGKLHQRLRKLLLHLTLLEEQQMCGMKSSAASKSIVFDNFFATYSPADLYLLTDITVYRGLLLALSMAGFQSTSIRAVRDRRDRYQITNATGQVMKLMMDNTLTVKTNKVATEPQPAATALLRPRLARLPKNRFRNFTAEEVRVHRPLSRERLPTLQRDMENILNDLSQAPSTMARELAESFTQLAVIDFPPAWRTGDPSKSCASALGLLPPEARSTWEGAYLWGKKALPTTIAKKLKAKGMNAHSCQFCVRY
jgi:hypothetical protein